VSESPLDRLLRAIDQLDADAAVALMAPDVRLLAVDGRQLQGTAAAAELLSGFFAALRSATHRITAQWQQDGVWIAEMEASYELQDRTRIGKLPRAFIVRDGPAGLSELHIYGAHERPLAEHRGEHEMRLGGHWIPPL
jgi:SnoaL-like domain